MVHRLQDYPHGTASLLKDRTSERTQSNCIPARSFIYRKNEHSVYRSGRVGQPGCGVTAYIRIVQWKRPDEESLTVARYERLKSSRVP